MIFSSCSSVISKPAPTSMSPFLSFTSLAKYLPIISSFEIEINFKPFSFNFFAITKFNFSPLPKTFFPSSEFIKSYDILIGLLKFSGSNSVVQLFFSETYLNMFVE